MLIDVNTLMPSFHMWVTFFLIMGAIVAFTNDKIPLEITSAAIISILLLFFHLFPMVDKSGLTIVDVRKILLGFANPALITVLALLVVGQAVVQTGALNEVANIILKITRNNAFLALVISLIVVMLVSGLLNNTPVVIIFIPIMAALSKSLNMSVSAVMMPLSFAAILGGMMTLIGSSTNLLVSGAMREVGMAPLGFFDFTIPGAVMASVGFLYVLFVAPKMLPDRASLAKSYVGDDDRQFITQIEMDSSSGFVGQKLDGDKIPEFQDITVRMIQRGEHAFLPPFEEDITLRYGDILIVSAKRKDLSDLLSKKPAVLLNNTPGAEGMKGDEDGAEIEADINMAEVIVTPASRMIGRTIEQVGFHHNHNCVVLGVQRQSRIIRTKISEIRLAAGDVLLILGKRDDVQALQESKDVLLLEWSAEEIHSGNMAKRAAGIFAFVVGIAAIDIVPISISSFIGATLVVLLGCLNVRQARRAIDSQIFLIVVASLALGTALQATGGANYLAHKLITVMQGFSPLVIMSALFILMAGITNILSNNASAVLFTPIAIGVANELGVDPNMFIFAVIFACNCCFMTPIGYQTNLLVMGPGHYRFSDYMKTGLPLTLIMWVTYTLFSKWYFNVPI